MSPGGWSLRSAYEDEVRRELARPVPLARVVTEEALHALPPSVRTYLQRAGVVGRPHVHNFRARFRAQIRGASDAAWMQATAEQYEFFAPAVRLFFMRATRGGLPVHVFHRYAADGATMRARLLGLFTVLDESGPELTQSETVTLLNDQFVFAPATLLDEAIRWSPVDERRVRATFRNAGHTVSAVAEFDAAGDLVNFRSDDRYRIDRRSRALVHWSTPLDDYRDYGGVRLARLGEAHWTEASGEEWAYGRFELEDIEYNVRG